MGQNCKPYMVLWYLLSIHSYSNPNADILVTSLVLKHCAHALRQPRGCYFNYVEVLKCHVEVLKCHVGVLRCHAKLCHDVDMGFLQNRMLGAGTCMLASGNMHVETQHLFLMVCVCVYWSM